MRRLYGCWGSNNSILVKFLKYIKCSIAVMLYDNYSYEVSKMPDSISAKLFKLRPTVRNCDSVDTHMHWYFVLWYFSFNSIYSQNCLKRHQSKDCQLEKHWSNRIRICSYRKFKFTYNFKVYIQCMKHFKN